MSENRIITREEAIQTLEEILQLDILPEDRTDLYVSVLDIQNCLKAELVSRHEWGMPRREMSLLSNNDAAWDDQDIDAAALLADATTFRPALTEKETIEQNIKQSLF